MSQPATTGRLFRHATAQAPGKVNLSLRVGAPRADGYHPVASVYLAVSMIEEVTATPRSEGEITVALSESSSAFVDPDAFPVDSSNLAVKAAVRLREHLELDPAEHGVHLEITKQVPVAGGMGGGSADAAAALVACAALWDAGLSRQALAEISAPLGADVPFAVMGGAAVGLGVGDELTPLLARHPLHFVLVPATTGLATPQVYGLLDRLREEEALPVPESDPEVDRELVQALTTGNAEELALLIANDLQVPAATMVPELSGMLDIGLEEGALAGQVSGSGPTLMFLARNAEESFQLATRIEDRTGVAAVAVHGPVHGARVL
ncbi:4-(cytidine 5'-diphospho)-2-C-methyl-D-erythritol kinase [Citricoccus sp. GCM10030269]|uniref:4-(cytidine 5'-diphospho)-2-C-methyl-D-erythritol kinase n=1 Tax=Citricoccus sp. GCM10030269 TaxID=3273388 RepID=UPI003618FE77